MDQHEERKVMRAIERCADALTQLASVIETKLNKPGPLQAVAALAKERDEMVTMIERLIEANSMHDGMDDERSATNVEAETLLERLKLRQPDSPGLHRIIELAHSVRLRARELFALPVKVCVEVDEHHWPELLDVLRASPEWAYSSGRGGDRPCEAELGDVVFRADLR